MSDLVAVDRDSAIQDLLASSYAAIYVYGVIAAYLSEPESALDCMAIYRKKRDELLAWCQELGISPIAARAAYQLSYPISDGASARAMGALLEDRVCAHWSQALYFLPSDLQKTESTFLQTAAVRSFVWSGITKAFFAAE